MWQELRDGMVKEYEKTSYDMGGSADFMNVTVWQANVVIPRGSQLEDFLQFLRDILVDDEVFSVAFGGAVGDILDVLVPEVLCKLVDKKTMTLKDDIMVEVSCGWMEDEPDWLDLIQSCIRSLTEVSASSGHGNSNEESTASIRSFTNFNESKSAGGNMSLKSNGTSCAGYASFYHDSFCGGSIDNMATEAAYSESKATLSPKLSPKRSPKMSPKLSPRSSGPAFARIQEACQADLDASLSEQADARSRIPKAA